MAEDLLGVAFVAAAGGSGTVGRPQIDKGIDLYLRRLRSMLTVPIQVKASLLVDQDARIVHYIPEADLRVLSGGYLALVHIPTPHDQLYERLFLIPDAEFRKRCPLVTYHGVPCYRFTAQFAGPVDKQWSSFVIEIDQLSAWITGLPGWSKLPTPTPSMKEAITRAENHDIAAIGSFWASGELERAALGHIVIVEDRVRLDPVTLLVHDLNTQRFAGLHLRTAIFNDTRRIHFEVKKPHFFADPDLWVLLVLLRPDRREHDYILLIPSTDIPELGFSETVTLDPLTKRFQPYQISSDDFGTVFMEKAFGGRRPRVSVPMNLKLAKAS